MTLHETPGTPRPSTDSADGPPADAVVPKDGVADAAQETRDGVAGAQDGGWISVSEVPISDDFADSGTGEDSDQTPASSPMAIAKLKDLPEFDQEVAKLRTEVMITVNRPLEPEEEEILARVQRRDFAALAKLPVLTVFFARKLNLVLRDQRLPCKLESVNAEVFDVLLHQLEEPVSFPCLKRMDLYQCTKELFEKFYVFEAPKGFDFQPIFNTESEG